MESSSMIRWEECKVDFKADGSLRDIYITPATIEDWRALYPLLKCSSGAEFTVDGDTEPLPTSVDQVFAIRLSASPMLRIKAGRVAVVFHFFSDDEIECDISPSEVRSQSELDGLLGFVGKIGDATQKQVFITQENRRNRPFISYNPITRDFKNHNLSL